MGQLRKFILGLILVALASTNFVAPANSSLITQTGAFSAEAFRWGLKAPSAGFTLTNIGVANGSGPTLSITVPAGGVPAGVAIYIYVYEADFAGGVGTNGSLADNSGTPNTYTVITGTTGGFSSRIMVFQAFNVTALTAGNTLTYTFVFAGNRVVMSAFYVTGTTTTNPYDSGTVNTILGNNANPAANQAGAPAQAGELFLSVAAYGDVAGPSGFVLDTGNGWTNSPPTTSLNATVAWNGVSGGQQTGVGTARPTTQPTFTDAANTQSTTIIFGVQHP